MSYLIPTPYPDMYSVEKPFGHTDTVELFKKNKKRFGSDWYWHDKSLTYKMNSAGYRMNKELTDVNFDNYYAFFGCSYTVGTGIPLEDTYSYAIAKTAGVDFINAGASAGSVEFTFHNIVTLFKNAPKKPKVLVINWPELARTCYWENNELRFMMPQMLGTSFKNYWIGSYKDFVMEDSHQHNRLEMYRDAVRIMCDEADIQLLEFSTHQSDDSFYDKHAGVHYAQVAHPDYESTELMHYNKGRDVAFDTAMSAHPGFLHQLRVSELFFREIQI